MVRPIPSPDTDRAAGTSPSEDVLYGVLSAQRRREALQELNEVEGEIGLAALARRIALRETGSGGDSAAADTRGIHLSLHHVHIPKLAAANAVEIDRAERTVSLTETGRAIASELEGLADRGA